MTVVINGDTGITTPGPSVVEATTTDAALRITQLGTGNALLVQDSANPDSSPFVVDSGGKVVIGTTAYDSTSTVDATLQIQGTSGTTASFSQYTWANSATSAPFHIFNKSNGSAIGTRGSVASGDTLGVVYFNGDDGTNFIRGASIFAQVDGTPGTNDMPGRLIFSTTADGASSATERMRIDSAGNVGIGTSSPSSYNSGYGSQTVIANAGGNAGATIVTSTSGNGSIYFADGSSGDTQYRGFIQYAHADDSLKFATAATERARIDSSGKFLVGTTNSSGGIFKVQATTDICLSVENATVVSGALTLSTINNAASVNVPLDFRASSIHASSGIATTANAANANFSAGENNKFYRSTSALKYKQAIRDLEYIDIGLFRPVRYKSKCEDDDQNKDHFGIIADEVHDAGLTELVSYGTEQEVEGFQYERLTVVLLKHCQEQQAIITQLQADVAALKA